MRLLRTIVLLLLALSVSKGQEANDEPELMVLDREDVDWKLSEELRDFPQEKDAYNGIFVVQGNSSEGNDDYYDDEEPSSNGGESTLLLVEDAYDNYLSDEPSSVSASAGIIGGYDDDGRGDTTFADSSLDQSMGDLSDYEDTDGADYSYDL